ncbi:MAG: pyruvate:ferredoxin (flavodoxin) oxidoreductase [candidate division Zixibacteria bacterium]|nr:pyruvate:ferredoxin (flavodoxin) oxidoreductase [candidate division Zixibacteria bacterium]
MARTFKTIDGNEAASYVAYRLNEVIAIYPITPSSPMGELSDAWSAVSEPNLWGAIPSVIEMQSEAGAAGAVHGALQAGALTTTFTSSQGLLLMIPNMFKIAAELLPTVFHVAARSVAAQALSIFGDHSDVMAARTTGFALISSSSVQEAHDFALIAQAATLESRVPFLHFFDGFRTSHEVQKIELLGTDVIRRMIDDDLVRAHRARALSPDHPVLRGSAQNPDVFFQAREACNSFYAATPGIVQAAMDRFAKLTDRRYRLFDYHGAPDAERVIVIMGSGADTVRETVDDLNAKGEKVGLLIPRLYRPLAADLLVRALPPTVRAIAVLDRTKEPGSMGEPLYLDLVAAIREDEAGTAPHLRQRPTIIGGRYGLSSKEFTPAMAKAVLDELAAKRPKNHFTVGIVDDVTHTSLTHDPSYRTNGAGRFSAVFYGLGADGTVGANKNSIKIIGEGTDNYAQGYFVYDSKKAGSVTVSHLRFGPKPIHSAYLIDEAQFVGCHQFAFLEQYDVLRQAAPGATILLNIPYEPDAVWDQLPRPVQETILAKGLRLYVIDAVRVAKESGMGGRINSVMQTCFFAISGIFPRDEAIHRIKEAIQSTYGSKGAEIVEMNYRAVDRTLENLHEVRIPDHVTATRDLPPVVPAEAPEFVRDVTAMMIAGRGDEIPVSAMPVDGTFPVGTARWEKRNIAMEIPVWDPDVCIACGKCAMVCPHSVIRIKVYDPSHLAEAPPTFKSFDAKDREWAGLKYTIQVAPEDCTGCAICVDVCPAKNKSQTRLKALNMAPQPPLRDSERINWEFFLRLPELDRDRVHHNTVRQSQVLEPLFEFSGACAGCGETPYIKLLTQLFGDRALIANATGCSSIYGGNLPTTPYTKNADGRGPAWANSLFEDNAEFGLGFRLTIDQQAQAARDLLRRMEGELDAALLTGLLSADQKDEAGIFEQRERVRLLKEKLQTIDSEPARHLLSLADMLVKKSVWMVGGDGWAYDIGYGGLDHVIASGRDVNILVLDTEVYSNTGGQMSKSTPRGAVAKFAAAGKATAKKDLALIATLYGNVYVARVAMGAKDEHTLRAFLEAESFPGPSLIIAYSHCIAHGIDMTQGLQNQKAAVSSGHWPLFRYDPRRAADGQNPLVLDSGAPKMPLADYLRMENRYQMLTKSHPEQAKALWKAAQGDVNQRWELYQRLAETKSDGAKDAKDAVVAGRQRVA